MIDVINRCGEDVPQVCYHPQLVPIQTCDTCIVEVDANANFVGDAFSKLNFFVVEDIFFSDR